MIGQYIIVILCVALAIGYVYKRLIKPFTSKGCNEGCGCATGELKNETKS
jgi:hypothetical protein